jgi:hypothetical protein
MKILCHLLVGTGDIKSVDIGFRGIIEPNHHLAHIFSKQVAVRLKPVIMAKVSCQMGELAAGTVLAEKWRAVVRVAETCLVLRSNMRFLLDLVPAVREGASHPVTTDSLQPILAYFCLFLSLVRR